MTERAASVEEEAGEDHFESLERQRETARFGMWIFLTSEVLLFAGLFALYAAERTRHPQGYVEGTHHADVLIGSVNTLVLIVSSFLVATAVHVLRADRRRAAAWLTSGTVLLGLAFLALKGTEYLSHAHEGALPGGRTTFYVQHPTEGLVSYFNLYWISTSLHALHVIVGVSLLGFFALSLFRGRLDAARSHRLEMGALYWHLVDAIWIFLWPLYYLMR